jgi:signal transduction histidine kinase
MVIVSKLENVNSSSRILKKQNEVKNYLLRLKTLHRVQGPSVISYERIGRLESADNFKEMNSKIIAILDTIKIKIDSVTNLDSLIISENRYSLNKQELKTLRKTMDNITLYNSIYTNMFDSIVQAHLSAISARKIPVWRDVLDDADLKLSTSLDTAEIVIDQQTNLRIKEIETRVSNVKQMTIFIISGVTLFAVLFGIFFSRAITNALRRLKESASSIGKGDFNFDPSGYPNDETGDLASAFFQMSLDLKNVQEELIQSKRLAAIGEVVASVNHEINNPLMIISGNAQFLEMIMENYPIEMKERVRTILEETERISRVTRKLREIKNPVVEDYTSSGEQMINLDKSSN